MRDILVLCPQERDLKAIRAAGLEDRYRFISRAPTSTQLESFDPDGLPGGVRDGFRRTASSARRTSRRCSPRSSPSGAGCRGRRPEALLACQHKPTARERAASSSRPRRRRAWRSSTARCRFDVPVLRQAGRSGASPQNAYRIDDPRELRRPARDRPLHAPATPRSRRWRAPIRPTPHGFLAEELLYGDEVTLEGYVARGPGHHDRRHRLRSSTRARISFERFEYPTRAPGGAPGRARRRGRARPAGARLRRRRSSTSSSSSRRRGRRRSSR